MKENRGRYSYLHPEREKYISGRSLGTNFDKDYLLNLFEANALAAEQEEKQRQTTEEKIQKCREICDELGVTLRVRPFEN